MKTPNSEYAKAEEFKGEIFSTRESVWGSKMFRFNTYLSVFDPLCKKYWAIGLLFMADSPYKMTTEGLTCRSGSVIG